MEKIVYNSDFFHILKNLITVSNSVIIRKEDDKVVVRRTDNEVTIAYNLKAPKEYFDFPTDNDDVTFYNYGEFYSYFTSFKKPDIYIDNMKLTLKENSSKIDYILSNPQSFEKKIPKEPNFGDSDISFNLSWQDHDEILKMIALIKPKKARITGNNEKISIVLFNQLHDNSFEKTFDAASVRPNEKINIDFMIFSDTFMHIPSKRSYTVNIKSAGFVKVSLIDENINLDIYTGKIKSN